METSPLDLLRNGNIAELKTRLEAGLDPNYAVGPSDHSLLTLACELGNVVERLAKAKSGVNAQPLPLALAAREGSAEMVKVLLDAKADPNRHSKYEKDTPLHSATTADVVDVLLAHGADPNAEDSRGDNPVAVAIFRGDFDVAHHFFEKLPELKNQKDQYERTPLIKAVATDNVEVANWLLDQGVEFDIADARGETPLTYAVVKKHTDLALKLIGLGAKGDAKDLKGNTPILWAHRYGLTEVVSKLIDMGCAAPDNDA